MNALSRETPSGDPFRFHEGRKTLSIMPTYACPAACADCATLSSPTDPNRLAAAHITAAIAEAKTLDFFNIVFTGGEATLRWPELLGWIRQAHDLGLPTRLVTNAHWAIRDETARARIVQLVAAGLSEINFSTGDEHVRFVPLERVARAVVAARRAGLPVHVMIEMREGNAVTRDALLDHPFLDALTPEQREPLSVMCSPWMPLEHDRSHSYPPGAAVDRRNLGLKRGCDSILQTYTLQADGRIGACCGLGMRLIDELQVGSSADENRLARAVEAAETDFLKIWLHYQGPEAIVAWAAGHDPAIVWEGQYSHHCQFCQRIYHDPRVRRVVRDHWQEVVGQVLQAVWLDRVAVPEALAAGREPADPQGSLCR
jgi:hypothetical protein